jgi:hypothetical protein
MATHIPAEYQPGPLRVSGQARVRERRGRRGRCKFGVGAGGCGRSAFGGRLPWCAVRLLGHSLRGTRLTNSARRSFFLLIVETTSKHSKSFKILARTHKQWSDLIIPCFRSFQLPIEHIYRARNPSQQNFYLFNNAIFAEMQRSKEGVCTG